jgi:hypothetical protein
MAQLAPVRPRRAEQLERESESAQPLDHSRRRRSCEHGDPVLAQHHPCQPEESAPRAVRGIAAELRRDHQPARLGDGPARLHGQPELGFDRQRPARRRQNDANRADELALGPRASVERVGVVAVTLLPCARGDDADRGQVAVAQSEDGGALALVARGLDA